MGCASYHKFGCRVHDARRGFGSRVGATAEGRLAMPCIKRADILKALFKSGVGAGGRRTGKFFSTIESGRMVGSFLMFGVCGNRSFLSKVKLWLKAQNNF